MVNVRGCVVVEGEKRKEIVTPRGPIIKEILLIFSYVIPRDKN